MKTRFTGALAATLAAAFLVVAPVAVAKDEKPVATTMTTVYVTGHGGSEIARKVAELHGKMEQQGWKFADMEVHTENGDTKGAWITYTK
jgi:ABC-type sugar transport system substrate-binding protein